MKRSVVETLLGAFVLLVAGVFLFYSMDKAGVAGPDGKTIVADFSQIGGLKVGDDVQISGVKIGAVSDIKLMTDTYLARVFMDIDPSLHIPTDTAALISSEGLLGGKYLALELGADEESIEDGGRIKFTQAPQNLEQLLGQFIFNMQSSDEEGS